MQHKLTYEQMIGQRIAVGLPGTTLDESYAELVRRYKIGNVILFSRNVHSIGQVRDLCGQIQSLVREETGFDAIISIDEEGGMVARLGPDATRLPGAMAIAATGDPGNAYTAGNISATELRALGINCNLAPSLDINTNRLNPVIGVRSYGDTSDTVTRFGTAMARGLVDKGVLCAVKHFPGHGDTDIDSHSGLPMIQKSIEELLACELVPFTAAIKESVPAVMTSHILFPGLEEHPVPATISRAIVTGLLRQRLRYEGLVFSDCLEMAAIRDTYGTVNASVEALRAGVDIIYISHTHALAAEAAEAIADGLRNGYIDGNEHGESVNRILEAKKWLAGQNRPPLEAVGSASHRRVAKAIMERSVCVVNQPEAEQPDLGPSPLFLGCPLFHTTPATDDTIRLDPFPVWMATHIGGTAAVTDEDPTTEDIVGLMEKTRGASSLVIGTYNGHLRQGQLALANAMAGTGLPTFVVALRNPYDLMYLTDNIHSLAAFEYTPLAFEAVRSILTKERTATGTMPVRW